MTTIVELSPDDSRFDEVRNEEWFKDLVNTTSIFDYVKNLKIEAIGYIYCGCGKVTPGYRATTLDRRNDMPADLGIACKNCIKLDALLQMVNMNWRFHYHTTNLKVFDQFIELPPQSITTEALHQATCDACHIGLIPSSLDPDDIPGLRSWGVSTYKARDVIDKHDNNLSVCGSCATKCGQCGVNYLNRNNNGVEFVNVHRVGEVCESCWAKLQEETEWSTCESCDTYILEDNLMYSEYRDQSLCQGCYEEDIECPDCGYCYYEDDGHDCDEDDDERSAYIHSYGYKPQPVFFGNDAYYLGLELEVEARRADLNEGAEIMWRALSDRGYLKYDGSLSDGFEIVTHPHSLDEMRQQFPWVALAQIQDLGFRSWNTTSCGIHVHVSRKAFKDDAHLIKFTKLIYDNERQVQRLAGRKSNYATFNDKGKLVAKVKFGNQSSGHYSAVNNENSNTVEVRVFRGSLRKERILSAIEFVHASVEYTRQIKMTPKDKPLSWARFVAYVVMNHEAYPNLITIMNELFEKDNEVIDQEEVNN